MGKQNYLDSLNEEQRRAVEYDGKHLLVLAGAGTGKTRTIISRAMYLMDKGVSPFRIVILSFTRKSANEIVSRIKAQDKKYIGVTGQTFHSWCMGIIKSNPNMFACYNATCLDEEDVGSAFELICGKKFKDKDGVSIQPKDVKEVFSYMRNVKCSLSEALRVKRYDNGDLQSCAIKIEKNKPVFEDVIRKYIQYKKEHNYIDYDDILSIVAIGLKRNKAAADFISSKYDHILIDEFQDTNPLQYELLSSFYDNCHLYCVGDDAQSIYGFRGADFKSMHHFTNVVKDSEVVKLTINYRSTQPVLEAANWVLRQSPLNYNKELKAARRNDGTKPKFIHIDNDWEEADHITDDIIQSVKEEGCKWNDCLVLSRGLFGLRKVEALCIKKEIPYTVYGGTGIMQSKHIRDVASALRVAANFRDELAWMRYLRLWERIGEVTATKIISSLFKANTLHDSILILKSLNLQKEMYETLQNLDGLQDNPSRAIEVAVESMEPRMKYIYKDATWSWESRKEDFSLLEEIATACANISEFIAEFVIEPKLNSGKKDPGTDLEHTILSTIHSAKGLEAKNVYVVGCNPNQYPTKRAVLNGFDAVEEERRCLYVAVTRAKDKLYLYKNIHTEHVENSYEESDDYKGKIEPNMIFMFKWGGCSDIRIKVDHIDEDGNVWWREGGEDYVECYLDNWSFRQQYLPEKEFSKIKKNSLYFLNDIPSTIIDKVTVNNTPAMEKGNYTGDRITTEELNDLDFS